MSTQVSFNYLAILVATVSTFVLGGLWYSPALFARAWMKEVGINPDAPGGKGDTGRIFGLAFILEFLMAFILAAFIGPQATALSGLGVGAAAGFGWVALSFGVNYLFERRSLRLFLINAGYLGVSFCLMGAILGAWH